MAFNSCCLSLPYSVPHNFAFPSCCHFQFSSFTASQPISALVQCPQSGWPRGGQQEKTLVLGTQDQRLHSSREKGPSCLLPYCSHLRNLPRRNLWWNPPEEKKITISCQGRRDTQAGARGKPEILERRKDSRAAEMLQQDHPPKQCKSPREGPNSSKKEQPRRGFDCNRWRRLYWSNWVASSVSEFSLLHSSTKGWSVSCVKVKGGPKGHRRGVWREAEIFSISMLIYFLAFIFQYQKQQSQLINWQ